MTLSTRSIAIQGLGFGPRHIALQGLVPGGATQPQRPMWRLPAKRKQRRDRDDDVLLFLLR